MAKESKAKQNNAGARCFIVLFIDKHYISQVIYFNRFPIPRWGKVFLRLLVSGQVLIILISRCALQI